MFLLTPEAKLGRRQDVCLMPLRDAEIHEECIGVSCTLYISSLIKILICYFSVRSKAILSTISFSKIELDFNKPLGVVDRCIAMLK